MEHFQKFNRKGVLVEARASRLQPIISDIKWTPPVGQLLKVNTDAAVRVLNKKSGIGVIFRNEKGEIMGTCLRWIPYVIDVDVVEAMAVREALTVALDVGFSALEVESDSEKVIQMLTHSEKNNSEMDLIGREIGFLAARLTYVSFRHVRRQANLVAHALAKMAVDEEQTGIWLEELPVGCGRSITQQVQKESTILRIGVEQRESDAMWTLGDRLHHFAVS